MATRTIVMAPAMEEIIMDAAPPVMTPATMDPNAQ